MIKYIGQHIFDFIARFRNDIYLENIADGTVDSDKFLGLDSSGKVVKETVVSSSGDITGVDITVGTGLDISQTNTTSGDYSSTINLDLTEVGVSGSANQLLTDDGDGTVTSHSNLTYDGTNLEITSNDLGAPDIILTSTANFSSGSTLIFHKDRASTIQSAGDVLGAISFQGEDSGGNSQTYAQIIGSVETSTTGQEGGQLIIQVATHNGIGATGMNIVEGDVSGEVDVTIGGGSSSVVTIPGFISIGGHTIDDIQVAGDTFADVDDQLMSAAAINDLIGAVGGGVSVSDSTANTNFPVVFHDESNNLHDDTGAFTYNPSTGTANIPIASIPKRKFAIPSDGAGNADGDVVYIGTGSTVIGKIYYYAANGTWQLTNSDDPSTATGWLAVALGTDPDVDGMLVRGTIDLAEDIVGTEALGSIIYLDKATTGAATTAAPTATGDIVRVIGYALTTGNENKIWFSPDNTWVEHV